MTHPMRQFSTIVLLSVAMLSAYAPFGEGRAATKTTLAKAPTKAKAARHVFSDPGRAGIVRWLEQLEADLQVYLRAKPGQDSKALAALLGRAYDANALKERLAAFKAVAIGFKATKVRLSGLDVRATLWHHRVPVRDLEVGFFRAGDHGLELLRLLTHKTYHTFFGGPPVLPRRTPAEQAIGAAVEQVAGLARDNKCDALPVVRPEHLEPFLPKLEGARKQTLFNFHKSRHRQKAHCFKASKLPYTHVTFRVSGVGGVLVDKAGERFGLRFRIMPRPDDTMNLAILTMSDPVAAKARRGSSNKPSATEPKASKPKKKKAPKP